MVFEKFLLLNFIIAFFVSIFFYNIKLKYFIKIKIFYFLKILKIFLIIPIILAKSIIMEVIGRYNIVKEIFIKEKFLDLMNGKQYPLLKHKKEINKLRI